eukprot:scaffold13.g320.t1
MGSRGPASPLAGAPAGAPARGPSWHGVPHDVFTVVLSYLEPADIALLRLVCRTWCCYHVRQLLWRLAPARAPPSLAALADAFPAVCELDLPMPPSSEAAQGSCSGSMCVSSGRGSSASNGSSGSSVASEDCADSGVSGGLGALAALPRLRRLTLRAQHGAVPAFADAATLLPLLALQQLEELTLQGFRIDGGGATALGRLTRVRALALAGCSLEECPPGGLPALLAPLRRLCTLGVSGHLRGAGPTADALDGLSRLSTLTAVALGGGVLVDDATCRQLAALPALASLELCRAAQDANSALTVTDAGVASFAQFSARLVRLLLRGHSGISDAGLASIARLTSLEHLDVRLHSWDARPPPLPGISDDGVACLTSLRRLRSLGLGWCRLGEAGCAALAGLPLLSRLELDSCASLGDAGLFRLARLPRLAHLGLRGCTGITDIGLAAVAKAQTRQLRALDLTGCFKSVGDAGLAALRGAARLASLELGHCEGVSDAGLEALLSGPAGAALESCDLRDCGRLTDRACALLAARAPRLRWLILEHCPGVGDAGLRRLAAGLPALGELRLFGSGVSAGAVDALAAEQERRPRGRQLRVVMRKQVWWVA